MIFKEFYIFRNLLLTLYDMYQTYETVFPLKKK